MQVGNLHVILLDADIPAVDGGSESLQQVLRHLKIQGARGVRIQAEELAVDMDMLARVGQLRAQAEVPVLRVLSLIAAKILY